jgi:hypothetical protein
MEKIFLIIRFNLRSTKDIMSISMHDKRFSKILVAVDGSGPSMDAADYAIFLAQQNDD